MSKRVFDLILSFLLLIGLSPVFVISYVISTIDTKSNGLFTQKRVGQYGKLFTIYKFKTVHPKSRRISAIGKFFRTYKIDELPQFYNVLVGDMSIVGPRPDIPGYYDLLQGEDRKVLALKPGLTSRASLKYANEEKLLNQMPDALRYNDQIIFPDKVKMNLDYYYNRSLKEDISIVFLTIKRIL